MTQLWYIDWQAKLLDLGSEVNIINTNRMFWFHISITIIIIIIIIMTMKWDCYVWKKFYFPDCSVICLSFSYFGYLTISSMLNLSLSFYLSISFYDTFFFLNWILLLSILSSFVWMSVCLSFLFLSCSLYFDIFVNQSLSVSLSILFLFLCCMFLLY